MRMCEQTLTQCRLAGPGRAEGGDVEVVGEIEDRLCRRLGILLLHARDELLGRCLLRVVRLGSVAQCRPIQIESELPAACTRRIRALLGTSAAISLSSSFARDKSI